MSNLSVDDSGRFIWLDDEGHRDFSPRTQDMIQLISLVIVIVMALVALGVYTGFVRPAPWSPMVQGGEQAAPYSGMFNPDATLDTSRMGDRP